MESARPPSNGSAAESRAVAREIFREIRPLVARAESANLGFVAYLLDMVATETARIVREGDDADDTDA